MKRLFLLIITLLSAVVVLGQNRVHYRGDFYYHNIKNLSDKAALIVGDDDLRWSAGNYMADAEHMGKALTLASASSQYAYVADNDTLDMGTEDFALSFWYKGTESDQSKIIYKRNSHTGYYVEFSSSDAGKIAFALGDGTESKTVISSISINDDKWHNMVLVIDRGSYIYCFLNGVYDNYADFSTRTGSVDNANSFIVGEGGTHYLDGDLDKLRIFRFGVNGLYVTGTPSSNLVIKVGDASGTTLYDETVITSPSIVPVGLIPDMYKSPYESLTNLGYSELDDADRSEVITDGDIPNNTNWVEVGTWSIAAGVATATGNSSNNDFYQNIDLQGNWPTINNSAWFEISYEVTANSLSGGSSGSRLVLMAATTEYITDTSTNLVETVGTHTLVVKSGSTSKYIQFRLNSTATGGTISIDNISAKRIGLVAEYDMNESSPPATLADNTSNGLDLTTSGSPTTSANYLVSPKERELLVPQQGSLEFFVRPNWDGDDGVEHYILYERYDSDNQLYLFKDTSNKLYFIIEDGGIWISVGNYNCSSWVAGDWHYIVCLFDKNTIDGNDYKKLYVDNSEVANSTTKVGYREGVETEFNLGSNYSSINQFDGSLHGRIWNIPLPVTEANAITAGLDSAYSIEGLYNAGEGYDIPVNENLIYKFPVERDEVSIKTMSNYKAWLSSNATNTTLTIPTADAQVIYDWVDKFPGDSCRFLVGTWAEYDHQTYAFETTVVKKANVNTGTGVITVSALTSEASYTTANLAFVSPNLVFDGFCEQYGENWTEDDVVEGYKDFSDVRTGSQAVKFIAGEDLDTAYVYIPVATSENYYASLWGKVAESSDDSAKVQFYDEDNSSILWDTGWKDSTNWENFNASFQIPTGCDTVICYVILDGDEDQANFDNILLIQIPNQNGGFEEDLATDYSIVGVPDTTRNSDNERSGTNALKLFDSDDSNYIYTEVSSVVNEYYILQGYAKVDSGDELMVVIVNNTDSTETMTIDETAYRYFGKTIKSTGTNLKFKFYNSATSDTSYVDDISIIPLKKDSASTNSPDSWYLPKNKVIIK